MPFLVGSSRLTGPPSWSETDAMQLNFPTLPTLRSPRLVRVAGLGNIPTRCYYSEDERSLK